jgi:hypothetical protein
MLKGCAKAVDGSWKSLCKAGSLYPQSTALSKYLTSQVFFVRKLFPGFPHDLPIFEQSDSSDFNLLCRYFYPLSTLPIATTNLIKE